MCRFFITLSFTGKLSLARWLKKAACHGFQEDHNITSQLICTCSPLLVYTTILSKKPQANENHHFPRLFRLRAAILFV
jgi:hypothetical protein